MTQPYQPGWIGVSTTSLVLFLHVAIISCITNPASSQEAETAIVLDVDTLQHLHLTGQSSAFPSKAPASTSVPLQVAIPDGPTLSLQLQPLRVWSPDARMHVYAGKKLIEARAPRFSHVWIDRQPVGMAAEGAEGQHAVSVARVAADGAVHLHVQFGKRHWQWSSSSDAPRVLSQRAAPD